MDSVPWKENSESQNFLQNFSKISTLLNVPWKVTRSIERRQWLHYRKCAMEREFRISESPSEFLESQPTAECAI